VTGTALVAGAVLGSIVTWRGTQVPPDTRVTRFTILQPADTVLGGYLRTGNPTSQPQFAVSPDGRHVVMVASRASVESLWLHSLDSNEIRQLAGTEGAGQPFWSPDSRLLAFFAAGRLKKLLIAGGQPIEICETGEGRGGTWNRDDVIVFKSERPETEEPGNRGLQRVPAGGGIPAAATAVDAPDVTSHSWPYFLPDGRHFLYVAASATPDWEIRVGSLGSSQVTRIGSTRSAVVYGAGHLFFWKDGSVVAQAFDPVSLRTAGTPLPVADGVGRGAMGDMSFSISDAGTVVFAPVIRPSLTQLTWFDRAGRPLATVGAPERNAAFALSPDGRRIVVTRDTELPGSQHLWIVDVASGLGSQLTFGQSGVATLPVWSHDSTRVAFSKGGTPVASELFVTSADGHGKEEQLLTDRGNEIPSDWSPDGRFLLFTQVNARDLDVWVLPLTGERKPFPFTESQGREDNATFSPDGRWVAYQSDELGETEIFVQPFPPTGAKFRVSRDGGRAPRWRNNGQEIFYIGRDGSVVAAPIALGDKVPTVGVQQTLFSTEYNRRRGRRFFSVTGDGQRFLMPVYQDPVPATPLHVILNWPATLAK
jgi:Tol biopolymer transport system component